jgi:hypothetical protein
MSSSRNSELQSVRQKLEILTRSIIKNEIKTATPWQGADVVIREKSLKQEKQNSFYPAPREVITSYVGELSGLFATFKEIFCKLDGYGFWKEELFGRLGNAANRALGRNPKLSLQNLLLAVTHEAFCIAEEMEDGNFVALSIAIGNQIYDDLFDEIAREGKADEKEVADFIRSLGVEL